MVSSTTADAGQPNMGKPQFASHSWLEPIIVLTIMISSLILNRRRGYRIIESQRGRSSTRSLLETNHDSHSADSSALDFDPLLDDNTNDTSSPTSSTSRNGPKQRNCCGAVIRTPNSSRFADHFHSRILQKFPFLVEMFYWVLNFAAYAITKVVAQNVLSYDGMWELAQSHGVAILNIEHKSFLSIFFPIDEASFQRWFLNNHHTTIITFLNRIYSLVHIPGTVTFLSWYYYSAPNFATFSLVRRTMTLGNFFAFFIFTLWPCMPPRLLPEKFGFHDTVRQENAESVFVGGAYVNQLAAMPSLHFTYAFVIGSTFLYHSAIFRRLQRGEIKKHPMIQIMWLTLGICYPLLVLTVIVATANHYFLDAVVAMFTVTLSLCINRVWFILLPAEDVLLWVLRLEKPVPTTGDRYGLQEARKGGRGWRIRKDEIAASRSGSAGSSDV